jgi:hypothetical protein
VIYEYPGPGEPIRQGDIFARVPRVDISLVDLCVVEAEKAADHTSWAAIAERSGELAVVAGVTPVPAIVITQDCDTVRAPDITLCEIKPFSELRAGGLPATPKKWVSLLLEQSMRNWKWFYLPPEERVGFSERMLADFLSTIRVPREELETLRSLRRGRLNPTADEHFRERLSDFYRRYPYNEWYPFDKAEFKAYKEGRPDETTAIEPYPVPTLIRGRSNAKRLRAPGRAREVTHVALVALVVWLPVVEEACRLRLFFPAEI